MLLLALVATALARPQGGPEDSSMEGPKPTGEGPPPMEEREEGEGSMEEVGMLGPYVTSGEEPSSRFLW